MQLKAFDKRGFSIFIAKFIAIFLLLYFGTLAIIGVSAPGNYYFPFIAKYLNYVEWITISLLKGVAYLLSIAGIPTDIDYKQSLIRFSNARGVIVSMSCVGYGVYSFWTAYVIASKQKFKKKMMWIIVGLFALWFINVCRIALFLTAINKGWPMPFGLNHHTLFNIAAYSCIFIMIYLFDKNLAKP